MTTDKNGTDGTSLPRGLAEAVSFAVSRGIVISQSKTARSGTDLTHAPFTYRPSPFNAACYHHAVDITIPLNHLVTRIARDVDYLRTVLDETGRADAEFTGRLLALLPESDSPSARPRIELSIARYDYFAHAMPEGPPMLRMVEMNCIAASFAALSTQMTALHRHLATHPGAPDLGVTDPGELPTNEGTSGLARGLWLAHREYLRLHPTAGSSTSVLMVVQPEERNAYDQFLLQDALWQFHGVRVVRASLTTIARSGSVDAENGQLWIVPDGEGELESVSISVVYFRAGYTPDDYFGDAEWEARSLLERSAAVKCPTIAMQLVGTKKVQQVLDKEKEVERFLSEPGDVEAIRETFAKQLSLSDSDGGAENARVGIEQCEDFVLKPQREGGGNNIYGEDVRRELERMSSEERAGYVLMERIRPVVVKNVVVRGGCTAETEMVSEFGTFGVHVECEGNVIDSFPAGTLLRSKAASQDDGGVAAGVAVLDSPMLVD